MKNKQCLLQYSLSLMLQNKFHGNINKNDINLFDGELQAKRLHKSLNGLRTDINTVIDVLGLLTENQIQRLLRHYEILFGKKLSTVFKNELGGEFENLCQDIILERKDFIIKKIEHHLREFPSPREDFLIALLSERSNEEVKTIKDVYQKKWGISLEEAFDTYIDPIGCKYVKILLNSMREDDMDLTSLQVHLDAQLLLNLGIGTQYNGSGPVMISLLKKRGFNHLRLVFSEYFRLSGGYHLWDKIEKKMQKDHKDRLILMMEAIYNPELFIARILLKTNNNGECFCDFLITIRLSRSKEFFKIVEHMYTKIRNVKMLEEIDKHSSGSVRALLCKLISYI